MICQVSSFGTHEPTVIELFVCIAIITQHDMESKTLKRVSAKEEVAWARAPAGRPDTALPWPLGPFVPVSFTPVPWVSEKKSVQGGPVDLAPLGKRASLGVEWDGYLRAPLGSPLLLFPNCPSLPNKVSFC